MKISIICNTKEKQDILSKWLIDNKVKWHGGNLFTDFLERKNLYSIDFGYGDKGKITFCTSKEFIMNNSDIIYNVFVPDSISSYLNPDKYIKEKDFIHILSTIRSQL